MVDRCEYSSESGFFSLGGLFQCQLAILIVTSYQGLLVEFRVGLLHPYHCVMPRAEYLSDINRGSRAFKNWHEFVDLVTEAGISELASLV